MTTLLLNFVILLFVQMMLEGFTGVAFGLIHAVTHLPAAILGREDHGLRVGAKADMVLLQAADPSEADPPEGDAPDGHPRRPSHC